MFQPKGIGGFTWRLLLYYVLLGVVPWAGFRDVYADLFRVGANAVVGSFGQTGRTEFEPAPESRPKSDTYIRFSIAGFPMWVRIAYNAWHAGWLPVATLLALVLATPIPWSRRWKALAWGLVWTHVFVLVRVFVFVLYGFSGPPFLQLFSVGPFAHKVLEVALELVAVSVGTSCLVPALIWLLVTFRREDWAEATACQRRRPAAA